MSDPGTDPAERRPYPALAGTDQVRPVFLAKSGYRQRRLRDGLRMVPVLGAVLWIVPLFWIGGRGGAGMAGAVIYVFSVWLFLILLSWGLTRYLRLEAEATDLDAGSGR